MVVMEAIREALNVRKRRLLLFAEAALLPDQFKAFRKLLLEELGSTGLERDLARVVQEALQGTGGKIHARKEVPHG